jgi:hypothetical protein
MQRVPISGHQNLHKTGHINQTHQKPSAGVKKSPHTWGLEPMATHNLTVTSRHREIISAVTHEKTCVHKIACRRDPNNTNWTSVPKCFIRISHSSSKSRRLRTSTTSSNTDYLQLPVHTLQRLWQLPKHQGPRKLSGSGRLILISSIVEVSCSGPVEAW